MNLQNTYIELRKINWVRVLFFYGLLMVGTYISRKLPNFLKLILQKISDLNFSWNFNHGISILVISFLFYRFSSVNQKITLLGNNKPKALLFPLILFLCYCISGIRNSQGINEHLWAFIFCGFAFTYNLMEEYVWRGYLFESLGNLNLTLKSIITGILWAIWHLLIFNNFNQYGGFTIFLLFCIVFSFILSFSSFQTNSVVAAASIHTFIIQINIAALVCFTLFMILLFFWKKNFYLFKSKL